jgi:predicted nucleic acid-binding protein
LSYKYLLDTNIISAAMRSELDLGTWLAGLPNGSRLMTCAIVRGEVLFGIARLEPGKRRTGLADKALQIFGAVSCESVPERAADFYAAVKIARQKDGLSLDECDLWIAATALAMDAILVTRDSDFARIEGLTVMSAGK